MSENESTPPDLGRNEPCHCGSGKKYKRCHGVGAAPKLSAPKAWGAGEGAGADGAGAPQYPGGFDPSKLDPQMMLQFSQALGRLPKGQLQKLQNIMQRAMSGQDVTREAADFERTLPMDIQTLMQSFAGQMAMGGMGGMGAPAVAQEPSEAEVKAAQANMTEDQARKIIEAAVAEGKISSEEAAKLLANSKS